MSTFTRLTEPQRAVLAAVLNVAAQGHNDILYISFFATGTPEGGARIAYEGHATTVTGFAAKPSLYKTLELAGYWLLDSTEPRIRLEMTLLPLAHAYGRYCRYRWLHRWLIDRSDEIGEGHAAWPKIASGLVGFVLGLLGSLWLQHLSH